MATVDIPEQPVNGHLKPAAEDAPKGSNGASVSKPAKLWIRLEESSNPGRDEHLLREVVKLLMNYPGKDQVALRIQTDGRTVIGELPRVPVKYCQELHEELTAMVGEGCVEVVGGAEA